MNNFEAFRILRQLIDNPLTFDDERKAMQAVLLYVDVLVEENKKLKGKLENQ